MNYSLCDFLQSAIYSSHLGSNIIILTTLFLDISNCVLPNIFNQQLKTHRRCYLYNQLQIIYWLTFWRHVNPEQPIDSQVKHLISSLIPRYVQKAFKGADVTLSINRPNPPLSRCLALHLAHAELTARFLGMSAGNPSARGCSHVSRLNVATRRSFLWNNCYQHMIPHKLRK